MKKTTNITENLCICDTAVFVTWHIKCQRRRIVREEKTHTEINPLVTHRTRHQTCDTCPYVTD